MTSFTEPSLSCSFDILGMKNDFLSNLMPLSKRNSSNFLITIPEFMNFFLPAALIFKIAMLSDYI